MKIYLDITRNQDLSWYVRAHVASGGLFWALNYKSTMSYGEVRQDIIHRLGKETIIMPGKTISKFAMLSLAYGLNEYFHKECTRNTRFKDILKWKEYHNAKIAEVPKEWYADIKKSLGLKGKQFTLQLGRCTPSYKEDAHCHKIGHQVILIVGPHSGFRDPVGTVTIGKKVLPVKEGEYYYFATNVPHTFEGDFYFINLQNPPLVDKEGNDDYHISNTI